MRDLEWPLNVIQGVCAGFGARCVRVDKVALFSVHKRSIKACRLIVKFDAYRNLQRHRAVLPAIARLSCSLCLWFQTIFVSTNVGILINWFELIRYREVFTPAYTSSFLVCSILLTSTVQSNCMHGERIFSGESCFRGSRNSFNGIQTRHLVYQ